MFKTKQNKQQAPNLKTILTKGAFSEKQVGVFKCPDKDVNAAQAYS